MRYVLSAFALLVTMSAPAWSQQAPDLDPLAPCEVALAPDSDLPSAAVGFWAFGFLDAASGEAHAVTTERLSTMITVLRSECAKAPGTRLYDLARILVQGQQSQEPPIAQAGRDLLMRFFNPNEDLEALTLSLKPTPEDVRAVYADPLATALIEAYEGMFVPGTALGPKPEHSQLLTTFATTGALKAGDPVLDEFPGGYREVLPYIVGDVPIARFKFVVKGETLGLAFDGLIYVNDHWVLMPKPWRGLSG